MCHIARGKQNVKNKNPDRNMLHLLPVSIEIIFTYVGLNQTYYESYFDLSCFLDDIITGKY